MVHAEVISLAVSTKISSSNFWCFLNANEFCQLEMLLWYQIQFFSPGSTHLNYETKWNECSCCHTGKHRLNESMDFEAGLSLLSDVPPVIIGDTKSSQGAVITRDRSDALPGHHEDGL